MTSVTVTFTEPHAWLTDVTDPSVSVHASYPDRSQSAQLDGDIRWYAGGRARVITSARDTRTYPLTLQLLSIAERDLLLGWRGRVLLLRDSAGRRVFGTFLALDVVDYYDAAGTLHDCSLVFTALSYSEAVT